MGAFMVLFRELQDAADILAKGSAAVGNMGESVRRIAENMDSALKEIKPRLAEQADALAELSLLYSKLSQRLGEVTDNYYDTEESVYMLLESNYSKDFGEWVPPSYGGSVSGSGGGGNGNSHKGPSSESGQPGGHGEPGEKNRPGWGIGTGGGAVLGGLGGSALGGLAGGSVLGGAAGDSVLGGRPNPELGGTVTPPEAFGSGGAAVIGGSVAGAVGGAALQGSGPEARVSDSQDGTQNTGQNSATPAAEKPPLSPEAAYWIDWLTQSYPAGVPIDTYFNALASIVTATATDPGAWDRFMATWEHFVSSLDTDTGTAAVPGGGTANAANAALTTEAVAAMLMTNGAGLFVGWLDSGSALYTASDEYEALYAEPDDLGEAEITPEVGIDSASGEGDSTNITPESGEVKFNSQGGGGGGSGRGGSGSGGRSGSGGGGGTNTGTTDSARPETEQHAQGATEQYKQESVEPEQAPITDTAEIPAEAPAEAAPIPKTPEAVEFETPVLNRAFTGIPGTEAENSGGGLAATAGAAVLTAAGATTATGIGVNALNKSSQDENDGEAKKEFGDKDDVPAVNKRAAFFGDLHENYYIEGALLSMAFSGAALAAGVKTRKKIKNQKYSIGDAVSAILKGGAVQDRPA